MKKWFLLTTLIPVTLSLSGCFLFSTKFWDYQKITVCSQPSGAKCVLRNKYAAWKLKTPETFRIHRADGMLQILCHKRGYIAVAYYVKGKAPFMPKGTLEPDHAPGPEAYNYGYPKEITVVLPPLPPASAYHEHGMKKHPTPKKHSKHHKH